MSARDIIRDYLVSKGPGYKFTNAELQGITGIHESVRRLRELREEGFVILSHRDLPGELRANEYKLGDPMRIAVTNRIGKRDSALHLAAHPFCDVCHRMAGDQNGNQLSQPDEQPAQSSETLSQPSLFDEPTVKSPELAVLTVHRGAHETLVVLCDHCRGKYDLKEVQPYRPSSLVDEIMVAPREYKKQIYLYLLGRTALGGEARG